MIEKKLFHAWFSQQAIDAGCGSSVYRRADGSEVEITAVYNAKNPNVPDRGGYAWPDAEYRGLVTEWVRAAIENYDDRFSRWSRYE